MTPEELSELRKRMPSGRLEELYDDLAEAQAVVERIKQDIRTEQENQYGAGSTLTS